jgi:AI-2 transport protein TqsA
LHLGVLKNFFLILMVTIFFLVEAPLFIKRMRQALGADHSLAHDVTTLAQTMVSYFGLRTIVNLVVAVATGLMLWYFNIDYVGLWVVLLFFLSFIPYIGAIVAMIPPVILAYAQGGLALAVTVGVLALVINSLIENIVAPMIMGKGLSISPTVVFLSSMFWMFVLGGAGAFIAMPLTMALILFMRSFAETRSLAAMMVTSPEPDSELTPAPPA